MKRIVLVACLLLLGACAGRYEGGVPVVSPATFSSPLWVDADPVCVEGAVFSDPDDCLAIIMLRQMGVAVSGLSTTRGNASGEIAYASAHLVAGDMPVYRGGAECGSQFHRAFRTAARGERITVLALGPLTNIANLLRCEPATALRIREIVFVGGRRVGQRFVSNPQLPWVREIRDLNVEEDVGALAYVLATNIPLRLVPFEAGNVVPLNVWGARFRGASMIPEALQTRVQGWSLLTSVAWGSGGLLAFDPVAVSALLWPHLFECAAVATEVTGNQLVVRPATTRAVAHYCLPKDAPTVREYLLHTLTR